MDDFYPSEKENRKKNFDSKKFDKKKIDAEYRYKKRAQKIKKRQISDQQADEIWEEWERRE